MDFRKRLIVERTQEGFCRWGGRVEIPMYWFVKDDLLGWKLTVSGMNSRGIELPDGARLYAGRKYFKIYHTKARNSVSRSGEVVLPAPDGIWVRDPEAFLRQIQTTGVLVVTEGPLEGATAGYFLPSLKDSCLALCGVGRKVLIPIIKEFKIKKVCFGLDMDWAGSVALVRAKQALLSANIGAEILDLREVLPKEVVDRFPSLSREELVTGKIRKTTDLNSILVDLLGSEQG